VTDFAIRAPVVNEGSRFVSGRLGNFQGHTAYFALLDQAWVE